MKRPRFEVIKLKVKRPFVGSSREVCKKLNRLVRKDQALVYLKHNTLVGNWAFWTAIVENIDVITLRARMPKSLAKKFGKTGPCA
jgi:hypothetical protein